MYANKDLSVRGMYLGITNLICIHLHNFKEVTCYTKVIGSHIKRKELFEEPREPFRHITPFLTN